MCQYVTKARSYTNCKQPECGWNVSPHVVTSRYIHKCKNPRPDSEGGEACAERFQTPRGEVEGEGGQTKVQGECPRCKASDEKAIEIFYVPYQTGLTDNSCRNEYSMQDDVVEQEPGVENGVIIEEPTHQVATRPRETGRSHGTHGSRKINTPSKSHKSRQDQDNGCCVS